MHIIIFVIITVPVTIIVIMLSKRRPTPPCTWLVRVVSYEPVRKQELGCGACRVGRFCLFFFQAQDCAKSLNLPGPTS